MSSEDYDRHIAQKYRLAISIAILNTKPNNLSIVEYLEQLKNIANEKNMDNDDDALDISACSDDFKIDNVEDIDDRNDLNQHMSHDKESLNSNGDIGNNDRIALGDIHINDKNPQSNDNGTFNDREAETDGIRTIHYKTKNNNDVKVSNRDNRKDPETIIYNGTLYIDKTKGNANKTQGNDDTIQGNDKKIQGNDHETQINADARDLNTSITILHNFEEVKETIDMNKDRRDKFREVIRVLKGVDVVPIEMVVNESQKIFYTNVQNKPFDPNDMDLTQYYDERNTLNESISMIVDLHKRSHEQSHTQHNFNIKKRNLGTVATKINNDTNTSERNTTNIETNQDNVKDIKKIIKKRMNDKKNSVSKPKIAKQSYESNKNNAEKSTEVYNIITTDDNVNSINNRLQDMSNRDKYQMASIRDNVAIDTEKMVYTSSNNSLQTVSDKDKSHIARVNKITIDTQENVLTIPDYTQFNTHYSQSQINEVVIDNKLIYGKKNYIDTKLDSVLKSQHVYKINTNKNNTENDTAFLLDTTNMNRESLAENVIENDAAFPTDMQNADANKDQATEFTESDTKIDNGCVVFDKTDIENTDLNLETDVEKVPFKIIEDMNIMKTYLKRKEFKEYLSYKTSQSKCSFGSTQSQNVCISESANSVFNYLSNCSLVTTTQELTEQLSEVLGKLIDRLHEEEMYPHFLEKLLYDISELLKLIYEENNYDSDVLLKKDEQIQRVILLNKSTHIQKYTIEKINCILQKLLDDISADNPTHEIQNINEIENLCYIFHILNIILPKYYITSQNNTQNSQDEKVLKKTDICDLWRKKWISNENKNPNEGSLTNKCVLTDCRAILNKIIVNFIDEYSLIAFSALKCFNIIQS